MSSSATACTHATYHSFMIKLKVWLQHNLKHVTADITECDRLSRLLTPGAMMLIMQPLC